MKTEVSIHEHHYGFSTEIVKNWNQIFGKFNFLKISNKNLTFISAINAFLENPHRAHSKLLEYGMDAITLKLEISDDSGIASDGLSDYLQLVEYAYRIAESNDRAIESTYFTYLISNPNHTLVKDTIVLVGFFFFGFLVFYVSLLGLVLFVCKSVQHDHSYANWNFIKNFKNLFSIFFPSKFNAYFL